MHSVACQTFRVLWKAPFEENASPRGHLIGQLLVYVDNSTFIRNIPHTQKKSSGVPPLEAVPCFYPLVPTKKTISFHTLQSWFKMLQHSYIYMTSWVMYSINVFNKTKIFIPITTLYIYTNCILCSKGTTEKGGKVFQ